MQRQGKRKRLFTIAMAGTLCAIAGAYSYWKLAGAGGIPPAEPGADLAGENGEPDPGTGPLFRFGNPYLDGRSEWFRGRFDSELDILGASHSPPPSPPEGGRHSPPPSPPEGWAASTPAGELAAPAPGTTRAKVHREPFTQGPWLAALPADLAAYRAEVESNAMESSFELAVEGVGAVDLLLFLVFADFRKGIEGIGEVERSVHLPPLPTALPGLPSPPRLGPGLFLCHEARKHPQPLARPTSLYHIYRVSRERGGILMRFELWKNTGGESDAAVHLDSGQYFIREGGGRATASFLSFYSGQKIPPLFGGMAESMTTDFYRKFTRGVEEGAPGWRAPPAALRWAEEVLGTGSARTAEATSEATSEARPEGTAKP